MAGAGSDECTVAAKALPVPTQRTTMQAEVGSYAMGKWWAVNTPIQTHWAPIGHLGALQTHTECASDRPHGRAPPHTAHHRARREA